MSPAGLRRQKTLTGLRLATYFPAMQLRLLLCLAAWSGQSVLPAESRDPFAIPVSDEDPWKAEQRKRDADHLAALPLFTASAARAETWFIWEGLPHPVSQKALFEKEKLRASVATLHDEPFYSRAAPVSAQSRAELQALLASPGTYIAYRGAKFCGGFHADFAIEWRANDRVYRALVCFGCHELLLASDDITLLCDLPDASVLRLGALLAPYRRERPSSASSAPSPAPGAATGANQAP